ALLCARREHQLGSLSADAAAGEGGEALHLRERSPQPRSHPRPLRIAISKEQADGEAHEELESERRRRRISRKAEYQAPAGGGAEQHGLARTDGGGVEDQRSAQTLESLLRVIVIADGGTARRQQDLGGRGSQAGREQLHAGLCEPQTAQRRPGVPATAPT